MKQISGLTLSSDEPGAKIYALGNEAIARGAIEAGVQVMAAYPGTPSTEIAETIINLAEQFNIYAEWSVNEKVAFGVAMGASMCGVRAMSVMKHVGVNVALDLLMTSAYLGTTSGLVLVEAEDPGQWSSSGEQDNRFLAEEAYLPVLEPGSVQEAKDMTRDAFSLSEKFQQPFIVRSVTRIGHARGDVILGEISRMRKSGTFQKDAGKYVMLPAASRRHRRAMVSRFARIKEAVDSLPYNQLKIVEGAKLGIIASGISYAYALEALSWLGLKDKVSVLKIGTPHPLPEKMIKQLLQAVPTIIVVEELEPFIENHVKAMAHDADINIKIHGKDFLPVVGEFSIRKVTEAVAGLTGLQLPVNFSNIDKLMKEVESLLPSRPPGLCAGCPHRASHYAMNMAIARIKQETGVEPIRPGDIGCYCLGANAPLNAVDTSTCMGSGFDLANGISRVSGVPVIAHLGDSTFFHSGIPPLVNAVFNKTRLVMVVLDNQTTAMTGSQPNPGSGSNAYSAEAPQVRPEDIARAAGVQFVRVADPYDLHNSVETLMEAIKFNGPSVVVFRSPCSILEQREKRARGEPTVPYQIEPDKCLQQSPPFCTAACPLHIDVRGYVGLAREGKYSEALKLIKEKLPFPAILGRICTHPCEKECLRGETDDSIAIMALKRSAADYGKIEDDLQIKEVRSEKVAIVGGGPAGLMAAHDLRKLGYQVTLFEAASVLGGMLALGIPEYRLPRDVLNKEISLIEKSGVEIKLNFRVGRDIKLSELRDKYQAVFLAVGAHKGKDPGIENTHINGVLDGIQWLRDIKTGQNIKAVDRVLVVGGGNVAIDCARTCVRLGFKEVNVMYRRSRQEMPALPEEINDAEKEGVRFTFLAVPVKLLAGDSGVVGAECVRMRLVEPEAGGRKRPVPIADSNFEINTDFVLLATGEQPDLSLLENDSIDLVLENGLIKVDSVSLQSSVSKIFSGGDVVTGPNTVIDALVAGRKAAVSIDRYIKGMPLQLNRECEGPIKSRLEVTTAGIKHQPRLPTPELPVDSRVSNLQEVKTGYTREESEKEASRCLSCGCQVCIKNLGCPAILIDGSEVIIDESQCPGCGICAQICPAEAIVKK